MNLDFIFQNESIESGGEEHIRKLFGDISDLLSRFTIASQELIVEIVKQWVQEGKLPAVQLSK